MLLSEQLHASNGLEVWAQNPGGWDYEIESAAMMRHLLLRQDSRLCIRSDAGGTGSGAGLKQPKWQAQGQERRKGGAFLLNASIVRLDLPFIYMGPSFLYIFVFFPRSPHRNMLWAGILSFQYSTRILTFLFFSAPRSSLCDGDKSYR